MKPKDGISIFEAIRTQSPDVVVMDSMMPHIDALGILKSFLHEAGKAPFFVVTGSYETAYLEKEMMRNGASCYMVKPFELNLLCDKIVSLTSQISSIKLSQNNPQPADIEILVTEVIHQIGVPAHIKGYHYLREAIILSIQDSEMINSVTKILYPAVAKKFKTTSSRGRTGHPAWYRSRLGPRRRRHFKLLFRIHSTYRKRKTNQFRVHRHDRRPPAFAVKKRSAGIYWTITGEQSKGI